MFTFYLDSMGVEMKKNMVRGTEWQAAYSSVCLATESAANESNSQRPTIDALREIRCVCYTFICNIKSSHRNDVDDDDVHAIEAAQDGLRCVSRAQTEY